MRRDGSVGRGVDVGERGIEEYILGMGVGDEKGGEKKKKWRCNL